MLKDVGLGIGIDYGMVRLVQMAGGLTVVGVPVVYACRLSEAPGGTTFVNQPAFNEISERFGAYCYLVEEELDVKSEGRMIAYSVKMNGKPFSPASPEWLKDS